MRKTGIKVPPRSRDGIYQVARKIRSVFLLDGPYVPIEKIYEVLLDILPGFNFEVVSKSVLGSEHGRTYPNKKLIMIREDVYEGACRGNPRDRFTMAHELGHLFLHTDVQFARDESTLPTKIFMDSEWQADTFASGFLIDDIALKTCKTVASVAETFGVSISAAKCRFSK